MSRSFFPTCSSQKAEMEEMSKELDGLRCEAEARAAECRAKSALVDGLRREAAEQAARLREARAEVERQAGEIAVKGQEASSAREACEGLRARFAEKEQAFRHLCAAHDGLKASLRERGEGWDAERRGLVAALEESEVKRLEQDVAMRSCNEEVSRLKRLLSEKEKRCSEAEQRALAQREVMMRDDTLAKLEEEKAAIQGKLKWKAEQFRHLEEALKKVRDEFRDAERQWGSDRSTLADQIGALETKLDSKTRVAEEFRSRLEMCSQALAHEEGRRKLLEAEMCDLRHMYGNVVSEYEEARSTIELLTSKRDGEIASLRSSLAEKSTLLNEMEYCKARLDQENDDLRSSLKEYQEAQIGGADAAGMLKGLQEKFRALEQTHRSCTEKLSRNETEWKAQMGKLENDLDGCLSQLDSKDMLIRQLQNELLSSYSSLEIQTVENLEASIVRLAVESKFYDSCSCIDTLKLNMQQQCEFFEQNVSAVKNQLEEKNLVIAQSQAEQGHQLEVMATLRGRIEQLECMEQEHEKMQRQLGAYKEMLDNASRNVHCLKEETSEKEKSLQEELGKALSDLDEAHRDLDEQKSQLSQFEINLHQQKQAVEHLEKLKVDLETELKGYMDDNHVLKRDLDVALNAKIGAEVSLREEKEKLLGALNEANCALSESKSKICENEITLHQQKQEVEHLEELRDDMETKLKGCVDENDVLKRDLDVATIAKMKAEEIHTEEKEKLLFALNEANFAVSEMKEELDQLKINIHQQKQAVECLEKIKVDMQTELKGYVDENNVLKKDLDVATIAKMKAEEINTEENEKLSVALNEANSAVSEMKEELDQLKINFHQQKQALECLEKLKVDMQTNLKGYKDENCALKRDLVLSLVAKFEVEGTLREETDKLSSIVDERDRNIEELQQYISVLEEDNLGQKLDVASLIKSEVRKSILEVNNRYSEIVEVFDKKLLELETRLGFFEQKYTRREHEVMEIFDQEEADWYMLIAEKENAIADIQLIVESVQLNIKHLLDAAASKLSEVQLEVQQLYGFAENLNSLNLIQDHDSYFKDMLIEECQRELVALQMKLVLEKEQSSNLKHVLEKLKAETTAEILEKAKEHLEVVNKLKHLEESKEMLEEHLEELKSRTKDICNVAVEERKQLVDELNGITCNIGAAIHADEDLKASLARIMQKANIEEPLLSSSSKEMPSLEKPNVRNHSPLTRNKSAALPDRRLPLKENNY
ncbi:uncharacterized protein At4g38062-like isoform X1 [Triticum urartu]|uniref:uncharacterized protein At4g38062-like isoform X1 n=2 Tax=Triticum urartu TaxID=4572 RepID=UPI002044C45F|nr:uncharacterized protein At4g38062-like isoform X1 [Triticum urartu]